MSQQLSVICQGYGTNQRIAFLCTNSAVYILIQWACWIAGQICVPLNPQYPNNLLEYFLKDSQACLLVTVPEYEEKCANLTKSISGLHTLVVDQNYYLPSTVLDWPSCLKNENDFLTIQKDGSIHVNEQFDENFYAKANAMILYTSGSTGRPKGSLITHSNLAAQAKCLTSSWYINSNDTLLHCAPLSHALGSIHTLACPLSVGSRVIMLPKFDVTNVWQTLLNENDPIDIFMAVPTMFKKLIDEHDRTIDDQSKSESIRKYCSEKIRLMVAGSAPLPQTIYDKWYQITGHQLLLRYGTTEIGMALSNSYVIDSVRKRSGQSVGRPMPGCHVKLVENGKTVAKMSGEYNRDWWSKTEMTKTALNVNDKMVTGEIYVRGPNVFSEYYNRPDSTKLSFDNGNWFKTGDYAKYENGVFSILGRTSVDVIKTGGHKVSALEIETQLLMAHSNIIDVCIVGVSDEVWGQIVGALIVLKESNNLIDIQKWCQLNLAIYQIPKRWIIVNEFKRNDMGKVNKKEVLKEYFNE